MLAAVGRASHPGLKGNSRSKLMEIAASSLAPRASDTPLVALRRRSEHQRKARGGALRRRLRSSRQSVLGVTLRPSRRKLRTAEAAVCALYTRPQLLSLRLEHPVDVPPQRR